jgi:hypothetical protein
MEKLNKLYSKYINLSKICTGVQTDQNKSVSVLTQTDSSIIKSQSKTNIKCKTRNIKIQTDEKKEPTPLTRKHSKSFEKIMRSNNTHSNL